MAKDSTIIWNKDTIESEDFALFLQKNEGAPKESVAASTKPSTIIQSVVEFNYVFVRLDDLYNVWEYCKWPDYLQSVGLMKYESDGYKLYPLLANENSMCVKLRFNTFINNAPTLNMYARVYGFVMFYVNDKVLPVHPEELDGQMPYVEMWVNNWSSLDSLQDAQRIENILYRINYSNLL